MKKLEIIIRPEKLEDLKNLQELMKAANKAIRLKDTEAGDDRLRELGFSEEEIKKLRTPDFCNRLGFAEDQGGDGCI